MKKRISTFVIQCGMVCAIASLMAATNVYAEEKKAKIESLVQKYADYGQFSGSILVAKKGNVIFKKSYGLANMEWNVSNSPTTKFRIVL